MSRSHATFYHPISLLSASGESFEVLEALVDTGATFASVPSQILERLGVVPERTIRLRLANGQIETRQIGIVRAEIDKEQTTILCVFGNPAAPPLIGAHTLEAFLLAVDPVERRLVPTDALWL